MVQKYRDQVEKGIIQILYEHQRFTHGELKTQVEQLLKCKSISPDLFAKRLKQMRRNNTKESKSDKASLYVIHPVLEMEDKGRGSNVYYSLTKAVRIRCDLKLPILKSDSIIERAYFLLLQYMALSGPKSSENYFKFNDKNKYNLFLQKIRITENELVELGKPRFNRNIYKIINWIHLESKIIFTRLDYLEGSDKFGEYEYSCRLPGIFASDVISMETREGLPLEYVKFSKKEAIEYLKLLEEKNIIKKIQSLPLIILNQERYILVDNSLADLLQKCWIIYGTARIHVDFVWKYIRKPTKNEKIWFEYMNGKQQAQLWLLYYNKTRKEYIKNRNTNTDKNIKNTIQWTSRGMKKKYELLKISYEKTINKYSYLIEPLLNIIYPEFLRN